jgi:hypothetical protein
VAEVLFFSWSSWWVGWIAGSKRPLNTSRAECLDWLLIVNENHLERVLKVFIDHHNGHRPHRGLQSEHPIIDRRRPNQRPDRNSYLWSAEIVWVACCTSMLARHDRNDAPFTVTVTATARKLAILLYRTLKGEIVYRDAGADTYDANSGRASSAASVSAPTPSASPREPRGARGNWGSRFL